MGFESELIQGVAWPGLAGRGQAGRGGARPGEAGLGKARRGLVLELILTERRNMANKATGVGPVTNGGSEAINLQVPYTVSLTIEGVADLLFHRWNCEAVEAKANAAKGSKAKKSDNIETYVYRDDKGHICVPGEYVRQAIIAAAKFRQDPRSPRKSARDLFNAGVVSLTELATLGRPTWDFEHKCRVTVQRNGITRVRPAMKVGWKAAFRLMVNTPEYIRPMDLQETLANAGRLIGVGDFRPTYGRFAVTTFAVEQ